MSEEITNLRKIGKIQEAYKLAIQRYAQDPNNIWVKRAYGWVLYEILKIEKNKKNPNFAFTKQKLYEYIKLDPERPSLLHSKILEITLSIFKDNTILDFFSFFKIWGYDNFRDEDYKNSQIIGQDGKKYIKSSLFSAMLQAIGRYSNKINYLVLGEDGWNKRYVDLFNKALSLDKNNKWLIRSYALFLRYIDKTDEAIKIYKENFKLFKNDFFYWDEMGDFLIKENLDLAIGMYCKAIMLSREEDFVGKIRFKLAEILIDKGEFSKAKFELEKYVENYNKNSWKVDSSFYSLYEKVERYSLENTMDFYKKQIKLADEYFYKDIDFTELVLYKIDTDKDKNQFFSFTDFDKVRLSFSENLLAKFIDIKDLKIDNSYNLKIKKENSKYILYEIKLSDKTKKDFNYENCKFYKEGRAFLNLFYKIDGKNINYDELCEVKKEFEKPDFGFIDDIYVPNFIINKFNIKKNCICFYKAYLNKFDRMSVYYLNIS